MECILDDIHDDIEDDTLTQPEVGPYPAGRGGRTNPPSAPPAIPPIIIEPFNRHIPSPAIDPHQSPPGPPIVPPRRPDLRM